MVSKQLDDRAAMALRSSQNTKIRNVPTPQDNRREHRRATKLDLESDSLKVNQTSPRLFTNETPGEVESRCWDSPVYRVPGSELEEGRPVAGTAPKVLSAESASHSGSLDRRRLAAMRQVDRSILQVSNSPAPPPKFRGSPAENGP
jgi:hypothetical protein